MELCVTQGGSRGFGSRFSARSHRGQRMRAIRRSSSVGDRSEAVLLSRLHNPLLRITLSLRVALVLGIVYLMTATPDLFKSVVGIAYPRPSG